MTRRRKLLLELAGLTLVLAGLAGAAYYLRARLGQGRAALARRDFEAADKALGEYLALLPWDADARLLAARAARRLGRLDEAEEHLEREERIRWLRLALPLASQQPGRPLRAGRCGGRLDGAP